MPLVSRTRATLRRAEFGFFGVVVYTRVQTPRRCGAARRFLRPCPDFRPGVATFFFGLLRPLRTIWLMLGMRALMLAVSWGTPYLRCSASSGLAVPSTASTLRPRSAWSVAPQEWRVDGTSAVDGLAVCSWQREINALVVHTADRGPTANCQLPAAKRLGRCRASGDGFCR